VKYSVPASILASRDASPEILRTASAETAFVLSTTSVERLPEITLSAETLREASVETAFDLSTISVERLPEITLSAETLREASAETAFDLLITSVESASDRPSYSSLCS